MIYLARFSPKQTVIYRPFSARLSILCQFQFGYRTHIPICANLHMVPIGNRLCQMYCTTVERDRAQTETLEASDRVKQQEI